MQLLYTDETNLDPKTADFFVYGGVIISGDRAGELSQSIDGLRKAFGYKPDDLLKFNTVERPKQITPEAHALIKQRVLESAAQCGVKMLVSVIMHRIALSPEEARRREINRISLHFDYYLRQNHDFGLVLIDTFTDNVLTRLLRERFGMGLAGLPYGPYRLKQILGFHISSIGTSHFCSVIDIVLGSLRFAINNRNDATKAPVVRTLLTQLSPLAIRLQNGQITEVCFFFSPKQIRAQAYLKEYQQLHAFLRQNGLDCCQTPGMP